MCSSGAVIVGNMKCFRVLYNVTSKNTLNSDGQTAEDMAHALKRELILDFYEAAEGKGHNKKHAGTGEDHGFHPRQLLEPNPFFDTFQSRSSTMSSSVFHTP